MDVFSWCIFAVNVANYNPLGEKFSYLADFMPTEDNDGGVDDIEEDGDNDAWTGRRT